MNKLQAKINILDEFQQRHHSLAFTYAVVKKYGEDRAGYQAALLTYYAFLSLFPLLLVLTTVTQFIVTNNAHLQTKIVHAVTDYFPVLGSQLSAHIHGLHKDGIALVVGLLIIFYGARGVADVFRYGVNQIWVATTNPKDNFLNSSLKSLKIIIAGAVGLIAASVFAGLTAAAGHGLAFRLLSACINTGILFWLFVYLLKLSLPRKTTFQEIRVGAVFAAVGLVILQLLGGYFLVHILKNLDALYSYFALALGLISWIYLQAQVVYYSIEVAAVKSHKLWPRSLSGHRLTVADKQSLTARQE